MTVNYRESFGLHASSRHPVQSREPAARHRVRHPQDHRRRGADQARARQANCALGNLDAKRDWGHARDYVRAMWLMLQQDTPDDYVDRDRPHRRAIREFCRSGVRPCRPRSRRTMSRQPAPAPPGRGGRAAGRCHPRPAAALGWRPEITLEEMVAEMVEADLVRHRSRMAA